MKMRKLALGLLAAAAAFGATGCGQRVDNPTPQTEAQTAAQTEARTEAVTEEQTEAPTEAITEVQTEAPTEAVTEEPVEIPVVPQFPEDLTAEEELELESELTASLEYYAVDDINIRSTPETENADNIISSFDQGEKATVIAETANWYKVSVDDWTGYVMKEFLSETAVEPKTPEERSEAADAAAAAAAETAPAQAAQEDVNSYAESFTIQMASDANLRSEASDQANIIGAVSAGDVITAVGETDNWYRVDIDGTTGYVNKSLVG